MYYNITMDFSPSLYDLVDFTFLICLYFFVFFRKWQTQGKDVLFTNTIFYIYLSFVFYFTLMPVITALPFIFNHPYVPMNLTPFIDVTFSRGDPMRQILLNILMTVPFGLLFPLVSQKPSFLRTLLFTFLLSLGIELIQPLLSINRSSDITDIITNVIGGVIGYIFYLIFRPLFTKLTTFLKNH